MSNTELKKQVAAMLRDHVLPEYVKAAKIENYFNLPVIYVFGICDFLNQKNKFLELHLFEDYLRKIGLTPLHFLFTSPYSRYRNGEDWRAGITDRIAWMQKLIAEVEGEK